MGFSKTIALVLFTVLLSSCDLSFLQTGKGQSGSLKPASARNKYSEAALEEAANAIQSRDGKIEEASRWIKDGGFDAVLKTKGSIVPPFEKTASDREEGSGTFPSVVFGRHDYPNAQSISILKDLLTNSVLDSRELVHGTDFLTQLQPIFFVRAVQNRKSILTAVAQNEKDPTVDYSAAGQVPYEIDAPVGYSKDADQAGLKLSSFTEAHDAKALQAPFPFGAFVTKAEIQKGVGKAIDDLPFLLAKAVSQPSDKVTGEIALGSYKVEKAGVSYALDLVWTEYEIVQLTLVRHLNLHDTSDEFKKALAKKENRPVYLDYFNEQKGKTDKFQFSYSKLPNYDFTDLTAVESALKKIFPGEEIKIHESDTPRLEKTAFLRLDNGKLLTAIIHVVSKPTVEPRRL
jgi:hypothetical protein